VALLTSPAVSSPHQGTRTGFTEQSNLPENPVSQVGKAAVLSDLVVPDIVGAWHATPVCIRRGRIFIVRGARFPGMGVHLKIPFHESAKR
jgi:hypothetical protein